MLNQVLLENIGLYHGKHVFSLRTTPRDKKTIVLLGGENGTGKTTLFDAIRLCLYGDTINGQRMGKKAYQTLVFGHFHHGKDPQSRVSAAGIEVEFDFSHLGEQHKYCVKRYWHVASGRLKERLEVLRDGLPLTDLSENQWQEFLNDLIPPALSKLLFFDGEKIQKIAEQTQASLELRSSMKSLLGLDIVERLDSDLQIFLRRLAKKEGTLDVRQDLDRIREAIDKLQSQLEKVEQKKAQMVAKRDRHLAELERTEQMLSAEGGSFAIQRNKVKGRLEAVEGQINLVGEEIRRFAADLLPFHICPDMNRELLAQLERENELLAWKTGLKHLKESYKESSKELRGTAKWKEIPSTTRKEILKVFKPSDKLPNGLKNVQVFHHLSGPQYEKVRHALTQILQNGKKKLRDYTETYEGLIEGRHNLQQKLNAAPSDDVIMPLITKLKKISAEMGALDQQTAQADEQTRKLTFGEVELRREERKILDTFKVNETSEKQVRLAKKARVALKLYRERLTVMKVKEFTELFRNNFQTLARKKDLIEKIEVDPKTFEVRIYKPGNRLWPQNKLSAGEKEIYALSMLWALLQSSGRPLPLVIDTPLSRLDKSHRKSVIQNFFPYASHQVIVLSTDTEVDKTLFKKLSPHMAHSYHLTESKGKTTVAEGYFWRQSS